MKNRKRLYGILTVILVIICSTEISLVNSKANENESLQIEHTTSNATIEFGNYPQKEVIDENTLNLLNDYAKELPTENNANGWESYKYYYRGNSENDFMWYKDVSLDFGKYRAVYFTNYRPYEVYCDNIQEKSNQDENGYFCENVYWFEFNPLKWKIAENNGDSLTLICESIIDSQPFQNEYYFSTSNYYTCTNNAPIGTFANNYEYSTLRIWLNDTFFNICFNDSEQDKILYTTVDNSERSTNANRSAIYYNSGKNKYACNETVDKVWIPSMQEITKTNYSFEENAFSYGFNSSRIKLASDYAKCQGLTYVLDYGYEGNANWWLRSPYHNNELFSRIVSYDGYSYNSIGRIGNTNYGIVPAINIKY